MEVGRISSNSYVKPQLAQNPNTVTKSVAFKGVPSGSNGAKKGWFYLRRLADEMKDITEIKNAVIAAIGTGIIAPLIILVSPGKGDKEDKDKKFLQALRQPISALLALGFQVPATMMINRGVDNLGFKKRMNFFKDEKIGDLIPTEKYLAKRVESKEFAALEAKFNEVKDGKSLKQELEATIKADYEEVGLKISDEELAKRVEKEKPDFIRKKIAKQKFEQFKEAKVQDILNNPSKYPNLADIKDIDLVTEDYQELAKQRFKTDYSKLEKEANLSGFDKFIRTMGFETKKTKALSDAQKAFKKEKGLELLKADSPEVFNDKAKKIKNFVEAYQKDADKFFNNKKFWLSLVINLFMVTASCFALNWIHPRVNEMIENNKDKLPYYEDFIKSIK